MIPGTTRIVGILESFLIILLVVLPVADLVDQHRRGEVNAGQVSGGSMVSSVGNRFSGGVEGPRNHTRLMALEMREETRSRGGGRSRAILPGTWKGLSHKPQQQHFAADLTDASSSSSFSSSSAQSMAFPRAFDTFPGLSSSSSSSSAVDSDSYEDEEFDDDDEDDARIIIPPLPKPPKPQRHHTYASQQQQQQHSPQHLHHSSRTTALVSAAVRREDLSRDVNSGKNNFISSHYHSRSGGSRSKQRKGSSKKHFASLVEPPVSLASSSRVSGPYFESNQTSVHITIKAGQNLILDCTVILLQGRTVSWLRRGIDSLQLLTVGNTTYYNDPRLGLRFRYPDNWRLGIDSVTKEDEGEYQCQLSTHPVKTLVYHLKVIAPIVIIQDEHGHSVTERHYKVDSSLHLTCKASHVDKFVDKVVWVKGDRPLSGTDSRIKIKVTKTEEIGEASIYLSVLSLRKEDSGNYSCRAGVLSKYTVIVHVVNGELPAAVQHESLATRLRLSLPTTCLLLLMSASTSVVAAIFSS